MKQSVVITSIFPPSEAVHKFSALREVELIVVGDLKSPSDWTCTGVRYLSTDMQKSMGFKLEKKLPYNHYCRKMIGYLDAISTGAEIIVDTDDDNIPKEGWGFPKFESKYDLLNGIEGFINIYKLYSEKKIWPRGLPLRLINLNTNLESKLMQKSVCVGIWQGLADEDPDVDAIYRLTDDSPTYFNTREPVVLANQVITPFNSQNTQFRKECFPLLYLPTSVTFRFTDILRGLVAQPILWCAGYSLGFTNATVIQRRNPHDFMRDFESEIPMYVNVERVIQVVSSVVKPTNSIGQNMHIAYENLLKENVITSDEMKTLDAWLDDLLRFSNASVS